MKGFELRVGGGTSIMPRVAPTLNEFVTADDGAYLMWAEAVLRIFDRQDWLRVNRARARLKVLVDKVGIDEVRRMVDEELEGDWVAERDFSIEDRVFLYDEQADAPAGAACLRLAQRRRRRVRPLPRGQRRGAAPGGLLDRPGQGHPRRPDAGAVPRARADHARVLRRPRPHDGAPEPRAALGARRGGLRRLAAPERARPRRRRRRPGQRRRLVPRHRLLQARHHELDGAQPRRSRSGSSRWASPTR